MDGKGRRTLKRCEGFGLAVTDGAKAILLTGDALETAVRTAQTQIRNARDGYIKRQLNVKSKRAANDFSARYKELELYGRRGDIQERYGYADITYDEMCGLENLWDERERARANGGKYSDEVTKLLDFAVSVLSEELYNQTEKARILIESLNEAAVRKALER